ncbi:MAG TPA: isochorismatase family cysteine hydrolase [Amycolatopsis sp.]|nr:isochorismatase family cysteine hydrolase [Amycolatopsis sp.]
MAIRGIQPGVGIALLTMECQNGPTNPEYSGPDGLAGQCEQRKIIDRIADLADVCREAGFPVFHNKLVHRPDWAGSGVNSPLLGSNKKRHKMVRGTPEVEMHPRLRAHPDDFYVERLTGVTPFYASALDQLLRNCDTRTVILTGVSTNLGIPGAAIEAVNRGYNVVIPEDCTAGVWPEAHEFQVKHTLPILAAMTTSDELVDAIRLMHSGTGERTGA